MEAKVSRVVRIERHSNGERYDAYHGPIHIGLAWRRRMMPTNRKWAVTVGQSVVYCATESDAYWTLVRLSMTTPMLFDEVA